MSKENDPIVIEVGFDERGMVGVNEWIIWADPNEEITWTSNFPFAIHFDRNSPMLSMVYNSAEIGSRHEVKARVVYNHQDGGGRRFSYYIASYMEDNELGKVVDIVDPEIIIPRGPRR